MSKFLVRTIPSILIALTLTACTEPEDSSVGSTVVNEQVEESSEDGDVARNPELWPVREVGPKSTDEIEQKITVLLAKMSIEEKVGQIVQPELKAVTPEDVRQYHLGSLLNGGGTAPNNDKYASVKDWVDLAQQYYDASMDESDGNVGIPLIWGSDAIHGHNNVFGATIFPHNIGLGAANDPELVERIGVATALEVVQTGVDWTFAPTVAVVRDDRWGRTYESYSEDPAIVAEYAKAMVEGIQGAEQTPGVHKSNKLVATAKHFVGDGGTTDGIDRGDTAVSEQELIDVHTPGYLGALDANVLTTMASFNSWNGEKLHGSEYLLTDILKKRMGFNGLIVSDWSGHAYVPGCTRTRCAQAINAGIDMAMVPSGWKEFYDNTVLDVKEGNISMERLDDAVRRVLRVKFMAGLFEAGPVKDRENVGNQEVLGNDQHRQLAREAVRKSLVLLKNNDSILPLSRTANILLAGDAADNIGKQSGGWTLSWQGTGNTNKDFPNGASIYDGFKEAVDEGNLHLDTEGKWDSSSFSNQKKPDVAVVVYGENPYAEWHGDVRGIEYQLGSKTDLALLKSLKEQDIPVVSVFISGRPLWVNKEMNQSDAFVAAWLPGSEGGGVADVLLKNAKGEVNHDFVGKLSFSWPKASKQLILNKGQEDYDPLFAYGYGLDYSSDVTLASDLDEEPGNVASNALQDAWLFVSRPIYPWEWVLKDPEHPEIIVTTNTAATGDDENLKFRSIDMASQEDARQMTWKGIRTSTVALQGQYPQVLDEYFKEDGYLAMQLRVNQAPTGNVIASMHCAKSCNDSVDLTEYLTAQSDAGWVDASIDLDCFTDSDDLPEAIFSALSIQSTGALDLSIANVKVIPIVEGADSAPLTFACDSP